MRPQAGKWCGGLALCVLVSAWLVQVRGEDEPAAPLDRKVLDQQAYSSLKEIINRGAELYNNGDPAACYYLFQGGLRVLQPMLDHRPDLQKAIGTALADAESNADMRRRAWTLRTALDQVRSTVNPKAVAIRPDTKKPGDTTLWERLGGEDGVRKVVDEFVGLAANDPKVNFSRDGKFKLTEEQAVELKKKLVGFISQATSGPIRYTGKDMKEVHKGMGITDAEFLASVEAMTKALIRNGVKGEDIDALAGILAKTRKDIVEEKEKKKEEKEKKP